MKNALQGTEDHDKCVFFHLLLFIFLQLGSCSFTLFFHIKWNCRKLILKELTTISFASSLLKENNMCSTVTINMVTCFSSHMQMVF